MFADELVPSANGNRKQKKKRTESDWRVKNPASGKAAAALRREKRRQKQRGEEGGGMSGGAHSANIQIISLVPVKRIKSSCINVCSFVQRCAASVCTDPNGHVNHK